LIGFQIITLVSTDERKAIKQEQQEQEAKTTQQKLGVCYVCLF
jgi:hypothetical protein